MPRLRTEILGIGCDLPVTFPSRLVDGGAVLLGPWEGNLPPPTPVSLRAWLTPIFCPFSPCRGLVVQLLRPRQPQRPVLPLHPTPAARKKARHLLEDLAGALLPPAIRCHEDPPCRAGPGVLSPPPPHTKDWARPFLPVHARRSWSLSLEPGQPCPTAGVRSEGPGGGGGFLCKGGGEPGHWGWVHMWGEGCCVVMSSGGAEEFGEPHLGLLGSWESFLGCGEADSADFAPHPCAKHTWLPLLPPQKKICAKALRQLWGWRGVL